MIHIGTRDQYSLQINSGFGILVFKEGWPFQFGKLELHNFLESLLFPRFFITVHSALITTGMTVRFIFSNLLSWHTHVSSHVFISTVWSKTKAKSVNWHNLIIWIIIYHSFISMLILCALLLSLEVELQQVSLILQDFPQYSTCFSSVVIRKILILLWVANSSSHLGRVFGSFQVLQKQWAWLSPSWSTVFFVSSQSLDICSTF